MTDLSTLVRYVEDYLDLTQEARTLSERDRDYYDGHQLTDEELAALRARKQPPVIFNRIKPKIDALLGFERAQRTDPKAYPRTPKHDTDAESVTDALRYVCDDQRFDMRRSQVAEDIFIEGTGGFLIGAKQSKRGYDITISDIPWSRLFWDPHSTRRDFSDAKYKGVIIWQDLDEAILLAPDKEAELKAAIRQDVDSDTFDDKPRFSWSDTKRQRLRVAQIYYREGGKWFTATFTKGAFIMDPRPCPFVDENGESVCPLEFGSAYIDRENQRYGVVRQHISPQDEINKRRSKALHLLNVRQVRMEEGAVSDINQLRAEVAKPDGVIVYTPGMEMEILPNGELSAGHVTLLQEAKNEIDASGVNPALQGDIQAPSGRAVQALQQAGLNELAIVFDAMRDLSHRVYRQAWFRIRQFWTEERWIRVTDDEQNMQWIGLNQPMTVKDMLDKQGMKPGVDYDPNDPRLSQPAGVANQVAELDVDIVLEDAPDTVNIQSEQFELLVQMYQASPETIPVDMVIEASTLRNKDRILKRLKGEEEGTESPAIAQAKQVLAQMQEQLQLCQQALAEAEAKAKSTDDKNAIEAQKVKIAAYEAETDRLRLQLEASQPQEAPQAAQSAQSAQPAQSDAGNSAVAYATTQGLQAVVQMVQQNVAQVEAAAAQVMEAAALSAQPKRKEGRMVRMADGSYAFEVVEVPDAG